MCEECRHYPCISACPNYEPPLFWDKCAECGSDLYIGNTAYKMGDKYYCEDCVIPLELEPLEPDDDLIYESWRDEQWEREHDV